MTRRTLGLGIAMSCLGFTQRKEQQMSTTTPEPVPVPTEPTKPTKPKSDPARRPYEETNRVAG